MSPGDSSAATDGTTVVRRLPGRPGGRRVTGYTLTDAWPRCLEIGGLAAGGASVVTETLTVAYDAMDPG